MSGKRVLALFDVDGTLTVPRKVCCASGTSKRRARGQQLVDGVIDSADRQPRNTQLPPGAAQGESYRELISAVSVAPCCGCKRSGWS
jgi:hypothetical protein